MYVVLRGCYLYSIISGILQGDRKSKTLFAAMKIVLWILKKFWYVLIETSS